MSGPLKTAARAAVRELETQARTMGFSTPTRVRKEVQTEVPIEVRRRMPIRTQQLDPAAQAVRPEPVKVGAVVAADGRNFLRCPRDRRRNRPDRQSQLDRASRLAAEKIVVRTVRPVAQLPRAVAMVQVAMAQQAVDTADRRVRHST
jgi:hypothetical protein